MEVSHFNELYEHQQDDLQKNLADLFASARSVWDRMDHVGAYTSGDIQEIERDHLPIEKKRFFALRDTVESCADVPLTQYFQCGDLMAYGGSVRMHTTHQLLHGSQMFTEYVGHVRGEEKDLSAATLDQMDDAPDPVPYDHEVWSPMVVAYIQVEMCAKMIIPALWRIVTLMHVDEVESEMPPAKVQKFCELAVYTYQGICTLEYATEEPEVIDHDVSEIFDIEAMVAQLG